MAKIYLTDVNSNAGSRNWSIGNGGTAYGALSFIVSNAADGVPADSTGTAVMSMDGVNKRVGIGTTSPEEKLHLTDGKLKIDKSSGNAGNDLEIHFDRRHDGADARIQVKGGASGAYGTEFHFITTLAGTGEGTAMVIDDYQNVGIGTETPTQRLEVNGDVRIQDSRNLFFQRYGDNYAWRIRNESASDSSTYGFSGANTLVFEVVSNSNVQATPSATSHAVYASSANTLVLKESGRVGVKTDSPGYVLDVNGTASMGTMRLANGFTWSEVSGTGYVQPSSWIRVNTVGLYTGTNGAHFYPNTVSDFGVWRINGTRNGWNGITFETGGVYNTLMSNGSTMGMYNDHENEWMLECTRNGTVRLYYDAVIRVETTSVGAKVVGNLRVDGGGNASDPLITTQGDTNTGIYFPGSGKTGIGGTGGLEVETDVVLTGGLHNSRADTTPAGTTFPNTIKAAAGSSRTIYFDGDGSGVSTWYGVGNNPFAAIDCSDGQMQLWTNDSSGTWNNALVLTSASVRVNGTLYFNDVNTRVGEGAGNAVRLTTNFGYIDLGPTNSSYCHIMTDRANFYFNKMLIVDSGIVQSYDDDLVLRRGSGGPSITVGTSSIAFSHKITSTSKSFLIDHPTKKGKKLQHGSLEGPENGVYVRGKCESNVIELPDYWTGLVDEDTITVQITPVGGWQQIYVEKIEDNKVYVGNPESDSFKFFYNVYGERKDIDKLEVEY
jgi:hypothetical protein